LYELITLFFVVLHFKLAFDEKEKKWTVVVVKEVIDVFIDVYYEYIFDCIAGTYTREKYERYNNKAMDLYGLPQLKNSKENKK